MKLAKMKCMTNFVTFKCYDFILLKNKNLCLEVHHFHHLSLTHTNRQKRKYTSLWVSEISHCAAGGRVSGRLYERLLSGRLVRRLNERLLSGRLIRRLNE